MNYEDFLRESLRDHPAPSYPPHVDGVLRMDANTNLFGVNPAVQRAFAAPIEWNQYPSPTCDDLRAALAELYTVTPDHVIVGDGSDEILDYVAKTFLNAGDTVCTLTPAFVMHAFYGRVNLGRVAEIPLDEKFQPDVEAVLATKAKLTILASPNNPTGNCFETVRIRQILNRSKGLVVVDEAYVEFCDQNGVAALSKHPNLIITRTFSKAYGLAGIRVGYAVASDKIIDLMNRVKPPFSVCAASERIALEALNDRAFMEESVRQVKAEKVYLAHEFRSRGFTPYPTDANFMLVKSGAIAGALRQRGVWVREMTEFPPIADCIRVTIGPREANDKLLEAIDDVQRHTS